MPATISTTWNGVDKENKELADEGATVEAAKHNPTALALLYQHHYPSISNFVRGRVWDRNQADDIVSDVFLLMVKNLSRYRVCGVPFRIWLFRIATCELSRWAKRRQRWALRRFQTSELNDMVTEPRGHSADTEMVSLVLATLPHRLQTVISLHYLEGMKISEISRVIQCSEGTVKSRLHDARNLMRERLERRGFTNEQ